MKQVIFIFFLLVSGVITVCACSARPDSFDVYHPRDFKESKAVFIGKVIDVSINDRPIKQPSRYDILYKIKFSVEKSWKGQSSEITVVSDNGEGQCGGFSFQVGEKYIVYAYPVDDRLFAWTGYRSPSKALDQEDFEVKRQLKQLNSFWFRWKANRLPL